MPNCLVLLILGSIHKAPSARKVYFGVQSYFSFSLTLQYVELNKYHQEDNPIKFGYEKQSYNPTALADSGMEDHQQNCSDQRNVVECGVENYKFHIIYI